MSHPFKVGMKLKLLKEGAQHLPKGKKLTISHFDDGWRDNQGHIVEYASLMCFKGSNLPFLLDDPKYPHEEWFKIVGQP